MVALQNDSGRRHHGIRPRLAFVNETRMTQSWNLHDGVGQVPGKLRLGEERSKFQISGNLKSSSGRHDEESIFKIVTLFHYRNFLNEILTCSKNN